MQSHRGSSEHTLSPQFPHAAVRYTQPQACPRTTHQQGAHPRGASSTSLLPSGAGRQRQGQRGDLGIPAVWSFCLCSPLSCCQNLGQNQPAALVPAEGTVPIAGHGVTEMFGGRTKVPTGSIGKPLAPHGQTFWTHRCHPASSGLSCSSGLNFPRHPVYTPMLVVLPVVRL